MLPKLEANLALEEAHRQLHDKDRQIKELENKLNKAYYFIHSRFHWTYNSIVARLERFVIPGGLRNAFFDEDSDDDWLFGPSDSETEDERPV